MVILFQDVVFFRNYRVLSYVFPCFHPYFNIHLLASKEDFPKMNLFLSKIMLTMLTLSMPSNSRLKQFPRSFNIGKRTTIDILEKLCAFQSTPSNLFPYDESRGETCDNPHSVKCLPCIYHQPKANEKHMFKCL